MKGFVAELLKRKSGGGIGKPFISDSSESECSIDDDSSSRRGPPCKGCGMDCPKCRCTPPRATARDRPETYRETLSKIPIGKQTNKRRKRQEDKNADVTAQAANTDEDRAEDMSAVGDETIGLQKRSVSPQSRWDNAVSRVRALANWSPPVPRAEKSRSKSPSAVDDKNIRLRSVQRQDEKADLTDLDDLTDSAVFGPGAKLWGMLEREAATPNSVVGFGDTPVFFTFDVFKEHKEDAFRRHQAFWLSSMKGIVRQEGVVTFDTSALLASVTPRPTSTGQPLASTSRSDEDKRKDLLGLFNKYNLEYRRPYPQHRNMMRMDVWDSVPTPWTLAPSNKAAVALFASADFGVAQNDLRGTQIWDEEQTDWDAFGKVSSSMIVKMKDGASSASSSSSAFGDIKTCLVRSVVTTSFPALCWLLGDCYTADEIEEAWKRMPLVKLPRDQSQDSRDAYGGSSSGRWSARRHEFHDTLQSEALT